MRKQTKTAREQGEYAEQWTRSHYSSPPLRPVSEMHMPRTDMRAEEFVLGRTGVTCVLDDHNVKRISAVSG
jgi:hypothetical protein